MQGDDANGPPDGIPMIPLFTSDDVAELVLRVRPRTFHSMVSRGEWPPADVRTNAKFVRWSRAVVVAAVRRLRGVEVSQ